MYADALLAIGTTTLLMVFFCGPWQSVCTDWARQIIFESRDKLFDMAQTGELAFDSEEYRTTRTSLECLIRYAHDLTLVGMVWNMTFHKGKTKSKLGNSVSKIQNIETRRKVDELTEHAQRAVLMMVGYKSVIGLIVLLVTFVIKPFRRMIVAIARTHVDDIQWEAEIAAC
jgi:hypothetical protein